MQSKLSCIVVKRNRIQHGKPDLLVLEFGHATSAGDGARIEQFDRKAW